MKQPANNSVPLVQPDDKGGHETFVRIGQAPIGDEPMTPATARLGVPTLTTDRELLGAIQELTAVMKEFMYVMVANSAP